MHEEKKAPRFPEVTFLPPLRMVLAFFEKESSETAGTEKAIPANEKKVEKLIEKLSEKE
jgi:hypothetical protein